MSTNETFGKQKDFRKFVMFFPRSRVQGKRKIKIMKKILLTLLLTFLTSIHSFSQEKITWHTDANAALQLAIKENKKVMFFFTGSDWCGWCIKLQKEVFRTDDFKEWSAEVILIELDYPRRTAQTDEIKAQNYQLQQMFGVKGYPAVHFVNVEKLDNGKMNLYSLGKTGYVRGGPNKWLEVANSILKKAI
jgi:thioredoxin-related protein